MEIFFVCVLLTVKLTVLHKKENRFKLLKIRPEDLQKNLVTCL
jgi:hypothetical protein